MRRAMFSGGYFSLLICTMKCYDREINRPFHKTLSRSSIFVNWISIRFYETDPPSTLKEQKTNKSFLNISFEPVLRQECQYRKMVIIIKCFSGHAEYFLAVGESFPPPLDRGQVTSPKQSIFFKPSLSVY